MVDPHRRPPTDVAKFQETHLNHLGKPLKIDGDIGFQTQWALDFETLCAPRRQIVRAAQTFLDLEECPIGSNTEPTGILAGWQKRCGAKPGDPWCACFCSHCIGRVRFASAQQLGKHFPPTLTPIAGDVGWYPTDAVHGHCFIIIGVNLTEVMSIEGNLRNGVRAARRLRGGLRFARTVEDVTGICPGIVPSVTLATGGTR